jgi:hypothetical protein
VEQEGQGAEHQNLDKKLNVEWDMERTAGMAETAWEKVAVEKKIEMEMTKTMAWTEKRMVKTEKTVEGTRKTAVVNENTKWESLYQNCHNTRQTDGRMILYNLKQKKKLNQEQEQELRLVY